MRPGDLGRGAKLRPKIILPGSNPVAVGPRPWEDFLAYESESGDFTLALGGDFMLTQRIRVYEEPGYLAVVDAMRNAAAAFTTGTPMTTVRELLDA